MDDIVREDRRIFQRELLSSGRVVYTILFLGAIIGINLAANNSWLGSYLIPSAVVLVGWGLLSYKAALKKRFRSRKFEALWNECVGRLDLFDDVLKRTRKDQVADWQEMPKTVERVAKSLYLALRRADIIADEVAQTEKGLYHQPPSWAIPSHDDQAKELYRIADKNIAEYRQSYGAVMAGVQRTEAQAAVFMTTVDSLRMKMLGHRLVGRQPEITTSDFLDAMNEAKLQLKAIDTALHELELMPYPKQITIMPDELPRLPDAPPPLPDEVRERLDQGQ